MRWLLLAILFSGCGRHSAAPLGRPLTGQEQAKVRQAITLLLSVNMGAQYNWGLGMYEQQRMAVAVLEGPGRPAWLPADADAAIDPATQIMVWNERTLRDYPEHWLADVLIDEWSHVPGNGGHEAYYKLSARLRGWWAEGGQAW